MIPTLLDKLPLPGLCSTSIMIAGKVPSLGTITYPIPFGTFESIIFLFREVGYGWTVPWMGICLRFISLEVSLLYHSSVHFSAQITCYPEPLQSFSGQQTLQSEFPPFRTPSRELVGLASQQLSEYTSLTCQFAHISSLPIFCVHLENVNEQIWVGVEYNTICTFKRIIYSNSLTTAVLGNF